MILPLLAPTVVRILFVGNSLLNFNDLPATVAKMLQSDGSERTVTYKSYFVGHLEDVTRGSEVDREVTSGPYDIVILQAAMVSSSMTRTYAQARGIEMAKAARARKARVILYAEWPRRGIDETEYTLNVYKGIAKAADAEIVPVAYAWNEVRAKLPAVNLWSPDGNHAQPTGSFVAACAVYVRLAGTTRTPSYRPSAVDASFAQVALKAARDVEAKVPHG